MASLDSIEFMICEACEDDLCWETVTPFINGVSLIELTRTVELPRAINEGKEDLAGSYAGWPTESWEPFPKHMWTDEFLNRRQYSWFPGDSGVLACTCGDPTCWCLTTIISINESTVTWSRFRMNHRDWDLSELGPFQFSRQHYLSALSDASGRTISELET